MRVETLISKVMPDELFQPPTFNFHQPRNADVTVKLTASNDGSFLS